MDGSLKLANAFNGCPESRRLRSSKNHSSSEDSDPKSAARIKMTKSTYSKWEMGNGKPKTALSHVTSTLVQRTTVDEIIQSILTCHRPESCGIGNSGAALWRSSSAQRQREEESGNCLLGRVQDGFSVNQLVQCTKFNSATSASLICMLWSYLELTCRHACRQSRGAAVVLQLCSV
jgi:hypothetical protein